MIFDPVAVDIRDAAASVNDRLKKLITPQDDEDFATDQNTPPADSLTMSTKRKVTSMSSSPQLQVTGYTSSSTPTPSTLTPSPSHSTTTTARESQDTTKTPLKSDSPKIGRSVTKLGNQSPNTSQKSDSGVSGTKSREGQGEGEAEMKEKKNSEEIGSELREPRLHLLAVLGVLIPHMKYTLPETRIETLRWLMWLHQQLPKRVREGGWREGGRRC